MALEKLNSNFQGKGDDAEQLQDIKWIEADKNRWGVRVLDVRPVTLTQLLGSTEYQHAKNAVSFLRDDGMGFIGEEPPVTRVTEANLRFPIDRLLAEGVLFIPREMEHKWALFYYCGEIICISSWFRQVQAIAQVEEQQHYIEVKAVRGTFTDEGEDPEFTVRVLDYLLRSHALNTVYPAPLPVGIEEDPIEAANWCLGMFGNRAFFATPHPIIDRYPDRPLRTSSLLHIAAARGDAPMIEARLDAGVPIDLLASDGLTPFHLSLMCDDLSIMTLLLDRGSPVDVRSAKGTTPLMDAVELGKLEKAIFLLDHGADVDARDRRGFTALHKAAGKGHLDLTRLLLELGASPNPEAEGHTPRSLAEGRGHSRIVALLSKHNSSAR